MQFLNGITVLLVYQLIGEVTVRIFKWPVPGPVLGMVLLFLTLILRGHWAKPLEPATTALLSHLSLLFVPAGVGVMVHFSRIGQQWVPIVLSLVISTLITLAATALIMQLAMRWSKKAEIKHE